MEEWLPEDDDEDFEASVEEDDDDLEYCEDEEDDRGLSPEDSIEEDDHNNLADGEDEEDSNLWGNDDPDWEPVDTEHSCSITHQVSSDGDEGYVERPLKKQKLDDEEHNHDSQIDDHEQPQYHPSLDITSNDEKSNSEDSSDE